MSSRRCTERPAAGASRFVGDPVDIVTGALVDEEVDFRLPGAASPFAWVRRFNSRQLTQDRGLGLGFRHELDHELLFDLDGITFTDSAWESTNFPRIMRDGQRALQGALALERLSERDYCVHLEHGRTLQFRFESLHEPARLDKLDDMPLSYERVAGGRQLSGVGLGELGRLHIEWFKGRITRIALSQTEPERETELIAYRYDEHGLLIEARNAYKHIQRYVFDDQRRLLKKS